MKLKKTIAFLLALTTLGSQLVIPASAEMFGDINGDGAINALDAAAILQYAAYAGAGGKLDFQAFLNAEQTPVPDEPYIPAPEPGKDEDDTLTILAWNDTDLNMMLDCYLEDHPDADVEIMLAGEVGGLAREQYKTLLQSGEQIDLYMAEPGWIRSYIDDANYALPLSSVGLTEEDYENAYPYAVEQGKNKNGKLYAAAADISPGGYVYNTDIAREYLGISTPEEMQVCISDWDGFLMTADRLHNATQGSVMMTATLGGMFQSFRKETEMPVLRDGLLNMERAGAFTKQAKWCIDHGYVDPQIVQWTMEWTEIGRDSGTLGYFFPTWCLGEGAMLEQNGGDAGNWAIVAGPQNYYWGGTLFCVAPSCNSPSEAEQFLRYFTVDADSMQKYAEHSGYMVNNRTVIEDIIASGEHGNPLLGGQDEFAVLHETAMNIDVQAAQISEWDEQLDDELMVLIQRNYTLTEDEILEMYQDLVLTEYGIQAETEE